jgi:cell division GTPase FtsZ
VFDFCIGLGQGGGRIANAFYNGFSIPTVYMNLAGIDFTHMKISSRDLLVFEEGGTGRNPKFGESVVRSRLDDVIRFLQRDEVRNAQRVLVTVGGGGGAGTGFLIPILDHLTDLKKDVFLIYTLPEKREGIPTKPNALEMLDRVIARYLQSESRRKISLLLIDNDFCVSRYGNGDGFDYWHSVNVGIVAGLKRFWLLTQLDRFSAFIDIASGYKALDANDVRRVLFAKNGYTDIRQVVFDSPKEDEGMMRKIKTSSLIFGSLDIRTAKQYVVSIGVPMGWKNYPRTGKFIEEVFQTVSKATRHTPDAIRTSYFNSKLVSMQVHILLSGMAKSPGIDRMIRGAEKDRVRLDSRGDVQRLDLENIVNRVKK